MAKISPELRVLVRRRAGNRCEYCLSPQALIMGRLQIDHVIPVARGGLNTEENLCQACELCNQNKWTQVEASDPDTGVVVPIFNPRKQVWHEHFAWSSGGTRIIGLTAEGRATVDALRINNELAQTVRQNWVSAGWHPPT